MDTDILVANDAGWFALSKEEKDMHSKVHSNSIYAKGWTLQGTEFMLAIHMANPLLVYHPMAAEPLPNGETILHLLAKKDELSLSHPEVSVVKDDNGDTPLHVLARVSKRALDHHDAWRVRNANGDTPLTVYMKHKSKN